MEYQINLKSENYHKKFLNGNVKYYSTDLNSLASFAKFMYTHKILQNNLFIHKIKNYKIYNNVIHIFMDECCGDLVKLKSILSENEKFSLFPIIMDQMLKNIYYICQCGICIDYDDPSCKILYKKLQDASYSFHFSFNVIKEFPNCNDKLERLKLIESFNKYLNLLTLEITNFMFPVNAKIKLEHVKRMFSNKFGTDDTTFLNLLSCIIEPKDDTYYTLYNEDFDFKKRENLEYEFTDGIVLGKMMDSFFLYLGNIRHPKINSPNVITFQLPRNYIEKNTIANKIKSLINKCGSNQGEYRYVIETFNYIRDTRCLKILGSSFANVCEEKFKSFITESNRFKKEYGEDNVDDILLYFEESRKYFAIQKLKQMGEK